MKKLLTLFSLSALFALNSFAQATFPTENATWTQRVGQGEGAAKYTVIGLKNENVVIAGKSYHKVFLSETDVTLGVSAYVGGLREDISARRIYYYDLSTSTERLLYDFSLSIGDTIHTGPGGSADGIVYNIDVVNIGGVDRTRITFRAMTSTAPWSAGEWVEGIGNTGLGGLLGSPMMQPTCDCGTKTICFANNGVTQYHNANFASIDCDNVFSPAGIDVLASDLVSVSPNPATGTANFRFGSASGLSELVLADITGKVVFSTSIAGVDQVSVDTRAMNPGLYVYSIHTINGSVMNGKLVVSK